MGYVKVPRKGAKLPKFTIIWMCDETLFLHESLMIVSTL